MHASPASLINQSNYPITALDSDAGRELITGMGADLDRDGSCCLRNFLNEDAVERLAAEARSLAPLAYPGPTEVTGVRDRLQSIFGFNPEPGIKGSMESNILHYGPRVAELGP